MKKIFAPMATFLTLFALSAQANLQKAPQSFKHGDSMAVFVDFEAAIYDIDLDVKAQQTTVTSIIQFKQEESGMPIFDLLVDPTQVAVDGETVKVSEIQDPDGETSFRLINKVIEPGMHSLTVKHSFERNTRYSGDTVAVGFWMSDLTDRKYIEQYLPTNLEYDQYEMVIDIQITNTDVEHEIFTNGTVANISKNHFAMVYPKYFTASSLYLHLAKKDSFERVDFTFSSINGAKVPVTVYSKYSWNMHNIQEKTLNVLNELESKFGAWGHPSLTVYIAGSGGMEHSGATITSLRALGHELTHSYFARGVMPINGNSGWLDEAIASWRDDGYESRERPFYSSTQMSGFSQYKRTTDRKAYTEGASFMEYLNHELGSKGGLRAFLENLYANYLHQSISTATFEKELNMFSGKDFGADFKRYVFGENKEEANKKSSSHSHKENPYHPQLTEKQLMDLL